MINLNKLIISSYVLIIGSVSITIIMWAFIGEKAYFYYLDGTSKYILLFILLLIICNSIRILIQLFTNFKEGCLISSRWIFNFLLFYCFILFNSYSTYSNSSDSLDISLFKLVMAISFGFVLLTYTILSKRMSKNET